MSTFDKFWKTIPTKNGLIMFLALAGFFLLMRAVGLAQVHWLRALNVVFVYLVIRNAIRTYHKKAGANYYDDFGDFFWIGIRTSLLGIGLFAAFMAVYLDQIDPQFMNMLEIKENFGGRITPVSAAAVVFLEGIASAFICAFVLIQLMKSRRVEGPTRQKDQLKNEVHKA